MHRRGARSDGGPGGCRGGVGGSSGHGLGAYSAEGSGGAAAAPGRSHRGWGRRVRRARVRQYRQAARRRVERRDSRDRRRVPLLRRSGADRPRRAGRRISAGLHQHDPPRSRRGRGLDRSLELSADDGGVEARPGARRRQHRRAQALGADAAHGAQAGRGHGRDFPEGRRERDLRTRRERRRAPGLASPGAHGVAHGRCLDGSENPERPLRPT